MPYYICVAGLVALYNNNYYYLINVTITVIFASVKKNLSYNASSGKCSCKSGYSLRTAAAPVQGSELIDLAGISAVT